MPNNHSNHYDFLIIAALREEFEATTRLLLVDNEFGSATKAREQYYPRSDDDDKPDSNFNENLSSEPRNIICEISFPIGEKRSLRGIVASPCSQGKIQTASLQSYLLAQYHFDIVGMVGIAGLTQKNRVSGDIKAKNPRLGDVVFATSIIDGDLGKLIDSSTFTVDRNVDSDHIIMRPVHYNVPAFVIDEFRRFLRIKSVFTRPTNQGEERHNNNPNVATNIKFQVFQGAVLSVNHVISSSQTMYNLAKAVSAQSHLSYPLAVEMEASGFAAPIKAFAQHTPYFLVKGLNDHADSNKSIAELFNRSESCHNSAYIAKEFIVFYLK